MRDAALYLKLTKNNKFKCEPPQFWMLGFRLRFIISDRVSSLLASAPIQLRLRRATWRAAAKQSISLAGTMPVWQHKSEKLSARQWQLL
jgi:hypothetical protein